VWAKLGSWGAKRCEFWPSGAGVCVDFGGRRRNLWVYAPNGGGVIGVRG
jgi:hypothetical protein